MLVRVEWSAINFKDAMVTRPGNRVARVFPLVPGVELTGMRRGEHEPRVHARTARARPGLRPRRGPPRRLRRLRPGPGRLGRAAPRRAELPHGRHHRPGRLHRPAVPAPPRPTRHDARGRADPGDRRLRRRRQRGRGSVGPRRLRGRGVVGQDRRARLPEGARRRRGRRARVHRGRRPDPRAPAVGRRRRLRRRQRRWPRRCARFATAARWRPAG